MVIDISINLVYDGAVGFSVCYFDANEYWNGFGTLGYCVLACIFKPNGKHLLILQ